MTQKFTTPCLLSIIAITIAIIAPLSGAFAKKEPSKPNVILIIADDVSVSDFGCYGNPNIRTPNIDKLADNGMRFSNAYLTTSQCSPTRCSIITGRYPHNTGAPELHTELPEGQIMFPAILKEAGFYTVAAGKWHMGEYAKGAFDKIVNGGAGGEERWIECLQQRPKDKPFFMWFASFDAHRPWQFDAEGKPHTPQDAIIPPYLIDTPNSRKDMAMYYDEIQRLDRYVGLVVKELEEQAILENTCIIFISDNGRPFPRCKTRLYDSGIKTPFVLHWPGGVMEQGSVCSSLLSVIDIAPTILELAGLNVSESFQGTTITPLINKPESSIRDYAFAEHNWHGQIAHERMVRYGDYVYIRNAHPDLPQICRLDDQCPQEELREMAKQGKLTEAQMDPLLAPRAAEELFEVSKDPFQLTNLADNPKYRKPLSRLQKVMNEWQKRTGDTTPSLEEATPDRWDRSTGKRIYKGSRPPSGIFPGQETEATKINDPGH
jgi:arylsulfatase